MTAALRPYPDPWHAWHADPRVIRLRPAPAGTSDVHGPPAPAPSADGTGTLIRDPHRGTTYHRNPRTPTQTRP